MNDPSAALQRLSAALDSGDRDSVMACFTADATLSVMSGEKRIAFTSKGIREAVETLMSGFDDIKLTPTSRLLSESRVVQESVISGDHTGSFAGAQATSGRVHVNVKLSATAGPDSNLKSLWVEADTRALFAQIAGTDDVAGATGALVATARERYDGAVRIIDGAKKLPVTPAATAGAAPRIRGSRLQWAALAVAAALILTVSLTWRPGSSDPALDAAADHPSGLATPTGSHTAKPGPTPAPSRPPVAPTPTAATALPVIAPVAPKSVPHVQAGRQVVLRSDVLFAFDSSALTPAAKAAVTRLAQQVRAAGVTGRIQVNGYTDNRGTKAYDRALSRARALAVARVLQTGLAGRPVTLVPQGFGQANPVAPNTTDSSRARNRRVTIVLPTVA